MDKLAAVNLMLTSIRRQPISSLDSPLEPDANTALAELDMVDHQVQSMGWRFNTEINAVFAVNTATNRIPVPPDVIRVEPSDLICSSVDPVVRGQYLYDRASRSYEFTAGVTMARVVRRLPWDLLPFPAQSYIARRAARVFASKMLPGEPQTPAAVEEQMAYADLLRDDADNSQANLLHNPAILGATNGRIRR